MKDKSTRNLTAGEALRALGLTDAAAGRYYYSLYQAAVHRLTLLGWTPGRVRRGAIEWSHVMVMKHVHLVRGRASDCDLYGAMRALRTRADYRDDNVDAGELADCVPAVREFVEEATA